MLTIITIDSANNNFQVLRIRANNNNSQRAISRPTQRRDRAPREEASALSGRQAHDMALVLQKGDDHLHEQEADRCFVPHLSTSVADTGPSVEAHILATRATRAREFLRRVACWQPAASGTLTTIS